MKGFIFITITLILTCTNIIHARAAKHITLRQPDQRQIRDHKTNDLYKSYLEHSAYRNKILSQNLANINTPGYKADEVYIPETFNDLDSNSGASHRVNMKRTSLKHITKHSESDAKFRVQKLKDPDEIKKNGNNVSMRQQMTKLSQNKNDYTTAVKGYATINSLFSTIIGK